MHNRLDLAHAIHHFGLKVGAEIGVADGRYSEKLCQIIPNVKLYCIDPWRTYSGNHRGGDEDQQGSNYEIAKKRLSSFDATLIRKTSMEAIHKFKDASLDFVFIDGNHDYDYVMEDLIGWSRKVRKGGIVAGHDYYPFKNSGVIEAVNDYVKFHKIRANIIGEIRKHNNDDYQPCFWWTKK